MGDIMTEHELLSILKRYRNYNDYYMKRFYTCKNCRNHCDGYCMSVICRPSLYICLRDGYSSDSPFMICKVRVFKNQGIEKWGAVKGKIYLVLLIDKIIKVGNLKQDQIIINKIEGEYNDE